MLCVSTFFCNFVFRKHERKEITMNDFRKYATQHLGMNGLVLDDVMKAQAQYMNPYILEERQLNVTQMDVFSRLMMDRVIFLARISTSISTRLVAASMLDWVSMIRCSLSLATWLLSVRALQPRWLPCCWFLVRRVSARHCPIVV